MQGSRKKAETVDEYIALYPEETQEKLQQIRELVKECAPEAEESISYAIPAYKINKKALIYYAGYSKHIGMYPLPKVLPKELEPNVAGKGTLQFPNNKPLPIDLIKKAIENRLREIN